MVNNVLCSVFLAAALAETEASTATATTTAFVLDPFGGEGDFPQGYPGASTATATTTAFVLDPIGEQGTQCSWDDYETSGCEKKELCRLDADGYTYCICNSETFEKHLGKYESCQCEQTVCREGHNACENGECLTKPVGLGESCLENEQCISGQCHLVSDPNNTSEDDAFGSIGTCVAECTSNADCPLAKPYCGQNSFKCISIQGRRAGIRGPSSGGGCFKDAHCRGRFQECNMRTKKCQSV